MGPNKNYIWYNRNNLCMYYVRRNYKTVKKYGEKTICIDDEKFIHAMKNVVQFPIIPDTPTYGNAVMNKTYKGIGEGLYLKIIIKENLTDYSMLKKISESRGTAIHVLLSSYNVQM